jgi:hypothetical protein
LVRLAAGLESLEGRRPVLGSGVVGRGRRRAGDIFIYKMSLPLLVNFNPPGVNYRPQS